MTPNPFVKQYLMTAGPTPVPPAVSQAMAAPMLYHRAPAFVEIYERVLGKLPGVFQTSNDVLCFSASGSGAMDSAAANLVRPGKPVLACAAGKFGERWIELCEAYGGETVRYEPGWGERLDPAEIDRLLVRERRDRGRLRDAQRDLDGHRPRRAGDRRGRQAPRRHPRRRRGLRPRRGRAAPGRLGHRRRHRRLPEGADVPARPRLRLRQPARARLRGGAAARPLLLRLEQDGQEPAQGRQPVHAGRRPVPRPRRRARHDRGRRASRTSSPATRCSPAPRAPAPPRSGWSCSATPTSARTSSRRSSCRRRSTAARSRARCASSASPPTAARTSSRARSSGSPTAATSAPSTS